MESLIQEIKVKLIDCLNLKHLSPEEIDTDAMLFGTGLGLDSIDALEIIVMLDNDYNIKFEDQEIAKQVFTSVRSIAEYVYENGKKS